MILSYSYIYINNTSTKIQQTPPNTPKVPGKKKILYIYIIKGRKTEKITAALKYLSRSLSQTSLLYFHIHILQPLFKYLTFFFLITHPTKTSNK